MRKIRILLAVVFLFSNFVFGGIEVKKPTAETETTFAIVVDKMTYQKTEEAVIKYRDAVQNDGLAAFIVIVEEVVPGDIKKKLRDLYKNDDLEGAVFIGDIPIPMIRDAQHMSSAFKMDQKRFDWFDSSIPSDRYYDDFDLEFEFLRKDSARSLLYYYSLKAISPQIVEKDIYSGRIKPPFDNDSKYDKIEKYLLKAVEAKKNPEYLNNAFVFTGHGYHSESLTAWADELVSLREQFPQMFALDGRLKHLNYRMSRKMKDILMSELSTEKLDMAVFHAHGAEQTQYILNYPCASNISQNVDEIKRFLRSKIRYFKRIGRDVEKAKEYYQEKYNVPDEWFEGTFKDSVVTADSLYDYQLDIHSDDLAKFSPKAEFIMFDECFNGSFHVENYIAGRYLFGDGNVIVAAANSVNVLQDKWANKLLGTFNYGLRVGKWHQYVNYLENHILGDPTFHFNKLDGMNLNEILRKNKDNKKYWESLLDHKSAEMRSLALNELYRIEGDKLIGKLVEIYNNDDSYNVRTHAMNLLAATDSKEFEDILLTSINDPYEFIRRKSAEWMGEIGDSRYIPTLVEVMMTDQSRRVSFTSKTALSVMNQDVAEKETEEYIAQLPDFVEKNELRDRFKSTYERNKQWLFDDILKNIKDDTLKVKKRISSVRTLRNYNFSQAVPEIIKVVLDEETPNKLKIASVEALGWFNFNESRKLIVNAMDKLISREHISDELKKEALKTKTRLLNGCNVPISP
jgi:hypothetical protein